jgi:hypothetical protein
MNVHMNFQRYKLKSNLGLATDTSTLEIDACIARLRKFGHPLRLVQSQVYFILFYLNFNFKKK